MASFGPAGSKYDGHGPATTIRHHGIAENESRCVGLTATL
jgi:hypothetical protein